MRFASSKCHQEKSKSRDGGREKLFPPIVTGNPASDMPCKDTYSMSQHVHHVCITSDSQNNGLSPSATKSCQPQRSLPLFGDEATSLSNMGTTLAFPPMPKPSVTRVTSRPCQLVV